MLDWTTSFLSDESIIKPREKSVKHFLADYRPLTDAANGALPVGVRIKMPRIWLRGTDENQEATPIALEDQPYLVESECNPYASVLSSSKLNLRW